MFMYVNIYFLKLFSLSQILGLERNLIEFLSPAICHIESLRRLGLSGNKMTNLPHEIEGMTKLQQLLLDDNQFEFIPIQV